MNEKDVLETLAALIAGGGIWGIMQLFFRRNGKDRTDRYAEKMIEDDNIRLRMERNALREHNAQHVKRIAELEKRIFELEMRLEVMQFAPFNIPLPMWQKNQFGIIDYVNDLYEEIFLKPRGLTKADYLGKTDYDAWPREIADEFRRNDEQVIRTGQTFNGREKIVDHTGKVTVWRTLKFFRQIPLGVAGIAFPDNGEMDLIFKTKKHNHGI